MTDFISELALRPLLCDGAMGTQLFQRGLPLGGCGVLWNTERPEMIQEVHLAYFAAGCDLLTTNTFGGSAFALDRHGLAGRMAELNRAGVRNARVAARNGAWILGNIGPFGDFLAPRGAMTRERLRLIYRAQANALLEEGVDALLIETMSDPEDAEIAIAAARECGKKPVIASYAFQKNGASDFCTIIGSKLDECIGRALAAGADVVGANCGVELGFDEHLELARRVVRAAGSAPVIIQPNAGSPQVIGGELVYQVTPGDMAQMVAPLLDAGVRIIGGCCGTSPEHLAAMYRELRQ